MTRERPRSCVGATDLGAGRCLFRLWAPFAHRVDLRIGSPSERVVPMTAAGRGYYEAIVEDAPPGCRYRFRLDGESREYADPASRYQPEGVHGPSEVARREFPWSDSGWRGLPLQDLVLYEVHVGTFTEAGTFEAMIGHLEDLRSLGVTTIELMPVAQFPGARNWGYDGVFPYAVQASYGGPLGFKRLVDACHERGMAVALDVVYNHLGPEGNVLGRFGPYFTDRYQTPWGPAMNFDGSNSDEVRRFFIDNALYWIEELHIDLLRLDAVHAIADSSPRTFLEELASSVKERVTDRRVYLVPESASNDARLVRPRALGGFGFDAVWNDDFHHALATLLTGEREGYYEDYGRLSHLENSFRDGFAYTGQYSNYRRRRHGTPSRDVPARRFVVFSQNHDQVGNRPLGDRLAARCSIEKLKLAAATVLLSPYVPLLFMGEEYGETAPFPYFVSHSDPELIEAVRRGRIQEFDRFHWDSEPPDPQEEKTFRSAKLGRDRNDFLLAFYRALLHLRRGLPALSRPSKEQTRVTGYDRHGVLEVHYWAEEPSPAQVAMLFHFGEEKVQIDLSWPRGVWNKRLDSSSNEFQGEGATTLDRLRTDGATLMTLAPWSVVLYEWDSTEQSPVIS